MTGGRERTADEFRELLKEAGFGLNQVIPTGAPLSIVEAHPEVVPRSGQRDPGTRYRGAGGSFWSAASPGVLVKRRTLSAAALQKDPPAVL